MSHFTRIRTKFVLRDYLVTALEDLGYEPEVGDVEVRGWQGKRSSAEVLLRVNKKGKYDIGFRKNGGTYECVADWYGIRGIKRGPFLEQLGQRYAYRVARDKLEAQGYTLENEETDDKGRLRLTLRRVA